MELGVLGAVELEASSGRKPYRSLSSGLVGGQKQTARISGKPLQVVPGIAFLCVCAQTRSVRLRGSVVGSLVGKSTPSSAFRGV